ncbi:phosphatase PAP2 family protein [Nesterenkonia halobia]
MTRIRRWPYTFAVCLSLAVGVAAMVASAQVGVPMKDPDGFLGPAYVRLPLLALLIFATGIIPAALRRRSWRELPQGVIDVVRHEWSLYRVFAIGIGLLAFYCCYVGYRNLKNVLPIYRDGVLFDEQLLAFDRWLGGGVDPAVLLHTILGTGLTADFLSFIYLAYLPLVPISLGFFLVCSRRISVGAWYATALSLNWVLGVVSYYLIPSLGPIFARPDLFRVLPETGVSDLQGALLYNRLDFLADPTMSEKIHGIAGFASLHVSVTFTAALFMHYTGQRLLMRVCAWAFFGLTMVATLYFGWHYIPDNVAGMAIGWGSVAIGAWATGNTRRRRRSAEEAVLDAELADQDDDEAVARPVSAGAAATPESPVVAEAESTLRDRR